MYYVLFHYLKGQKERDFRAFRSGDDVIEFLHEKHKEIEVGRIIKTTKVYNLGLIETEEHIKPLTRMNPEEPEEAEEEPIEPEEPGEIEEPEEEKDINEVLDKADKVIEKGEKFLEDRKADWPICPKCGVNKYAPWNKKKICSRCQRGQKTQRNK